ncbi:MAG: sugar ABC transporter permease [Clostridiales bacterium]|nr:sugar ABC transporter permease [Clostridiales bacterium]
MSYIRVTGDSAQSRPEKRKRWDRIALLFIAPYVIFTLTFLIYPLGMAIIGSLAKWDMISNSFVQFTGLSNYVRLVNDPKFWQSVLNSLIYFVVQIPLAIVGGMFVANLLNKKIIARDLFRGLYFLPVITGSVVLAILWRWMYQSSNGIINYLLSLIGVEPVKWLTDASITMLSISLMKAWMDVGFYTIVFLAGYQSISAELLDAAKVDGANDIQVYFKIKLPLLNPTIVFCIMMATIWAFQIFNEPYIMTGGGPLGSSTTMTLLLYKVGFIEHNMGYASTIGVAIGIIIFVTSILERRLFEREIE